MAAKAAPSIEAPMINLVNQDAGAHAEPRHDADPANQQMSGGQIANVEDPRATLPKRSATLPGPKFMAMADAQALEAHVGRRRKLPAQIKSENPSRREEEIERAWNNLERR